MVAGDFKLVIAGFYSRGVTKCNYTKDKRVAVRVSQVNRSGLLLAGLCVVSGGVLREGSAFFGWGGMAHLHGSQKAETQVGPCVSADGPVI